MQGGNEKLPISSSTAKLRTKLTVCALIGGQQTLRVLGRRPGYLQEILWITANLVCSFVLETGKKNVKWHLVNVRVTEAVAS